MAWRYVSHPIGDGHLVLDGEPSYCHVLDRTRHVEKLCKRGVWLFYNWALWSAPDQAGIGLALEIARAFSGRINLAIRPFDEFAELAIFEPAVPERFVSPVWVVLINGRVHWYVSGLLEAKALIGRIEETIHR
jgi:hypothetical protein